MIQIQQIFHKNGFLIGRIIDQDAEILNVMIHPDYRRLGKASKLIGRLKKKQKMQDLQKFLEVAESNNSAKNFIVLGYLKVGQRNNYYKFVDGRKDNAAILSKEI